MKNNVRGLQGLRVCCLIGVLLTASWYSYCGAWDCSIGCRSEYFDDYPLLYAFDNNYDIVIASYLDGSFNQIIYGNVHDRTSASCDEFGSNVLPYWYDSDPYELTCCEQPSCSTTYLEMVYDDETLYNFSFPDGQSSFYVCEACSS
jgi:hypothetical protein